MGKFCSKCGKKLEEGEVCSCTANQPVTSQPGAAVNPQPQVANQTQQKVNPVQQPQYQQPQYQQPQYQQPQQQQPQYQQPQYQQPQYQQPQQQQPQYQQPQYQQPRQQPQYQQSRQQPQYQRPNIPNNVNPAQSEGILTLVIAIIGFVLLLFGASWLGFIIYLVAFINAILKTKKRFQNENISISDFIKILLGEIFSKDLLNKGCYSIVLALFPIMLIYFGHDLYVAHTINKYEDAVSSAFENFGF